MSDQTGQRPEKLYFNGIDASNGGYILPPMHPKEFSEAMAGFTNEKEVRQIASTMEEHFGLVGGHDPNLLEESGWGVVFPAKIDPAIKQALNPLLEWRRSQAGKEVEHYYREMDYFPGEEKNDWLARYDYGPGSADPEFVPYYLMLVGGPEDIPFAFQTSLDVQYAVGRICFDTVQEYANYAESVVRAEKEQLQLARRISFFAVANDDDPATQLSSEHLVPPLVNYARTKSPKDQPGWDVQHVTGKDASKECLADLLGGSNTPAMLFTASHGIKFPNGDSLQEKRQGALLTSDFPGPRSWTGGPLDPDHYLCAEDLKDDRKMWGTLAFFFACYGAGTPKLDEFAHRHLKKAGEIAKRDFVARLPQRMLSHPNGGALAVIGHIERAWDSSFIAEGNPVTQTFRTALFRLMKGNPVGFAFEQFNEKYGELSTDLTKQIKLVRNEMPFDPYAVSALFTAINDAKNYAIIGDPAVRLMAAPHPTDGMVERPSISIPSQPLEPAPPDDTELKPESGAKNGSTAKAKAHAGTQGFDISAPGSLDQKLDAFLHEVVEQAGTLTVRTYTSANPGPVDASGLPANAVLRAVTVVRAMAEVENVVPVNDDGSVEERLWAAHLDMVRQAQQAQAGMVQVLRKAADKSEEPIG